jgi:hypothetical protein
VRSYELTGNYRRAYGLLVAAERVAVSAVVAEFLDDRVPLVRPDDVSVLHGASIMGRRVPGTDLVVCYVPAGEQVFVVNLRRHPA